MAFKGLCDVRREGRERREEGGGGKRKIGRDGEEIRVKKGERELGEGRQKGIRYKRMVTTIWQF